MKLAISCQWNEAFREIAEITLPVMHAYALKYGMEHSEGEWQPRDFILHLPGIGNKRRVEILKDHLRLMKEGAS